MPTLKTILAVTILFAPCWMSRSETASFCRMQEPGSTGHELLKIEMTPLEVLGKPDEGPYLVGNKVRLKVIAKNDSDQLVMVRVDDPYFRNRPRLYNGNQLVPYRSEITKLIRSKDEFPVLVSVGRFVSLNPYSTAILRELDLNDWYDPLEPGSYRLINRYRFDEGKTWSADSKPLSFQVVKR